MLMELVTVSRGMVPFRVRGPDGESAAEEGVVLS